MKVKEYLNHLLGIFENSENSSKIDSVRKSLIDQGKKIETDVNWDLSQTKLFDSFLGISLDYGRYTEYRLMDIKRAEVSKALDIIASLAAGDIRIVSSDQTFIESASAFIDTLLNYLERSQNVSLFSLIRKLAKYGDLYVEPTYAKIGNNKIITGLRLHEPDYFRIIDVKAPSAILERYRGEFEGRIPTKLVIYLIRVARSQDRALAAYKLEPFRNNFEFDAHSQNFPTTIYSDRDIEVLLERSKRGELVLLEEGYDIFHVPYNVDVYKPYGTSLLDSARYMFRILNMLENIILTYRLTHTPRIIWRFPAGKMDAEKMMEYLENMRQTIKKQLSLSRYNEADSFESLPKLLGIPEDIFITHRENMEPKVEVFNMGDEAKNLEDYVRVLESFYNGLKVPKHLIKGENEGDVVTAAVLSEDRFLRSLILGVRRPLEIFFERVISLQSKLLNNIPSDFRVEIATPEEIQDKLSKEESDQVKKAKTQLVPDQKITENPDSLTQ